MTLVEGLQGGEAAPIVKSHHSPSDGGGAMLMLAIVSDQQREPQDLGQMRPVPPPETLGLRGLIAGAVGEMAGQTTSLARRGAGQAIRYVRDPIGYVRGAAAMARSVYRT